MQCSSGQRALENHGRRAAVLRQQVTAGCDRREQLRTPSGQGLLFLLCCMSHCRTELEELKATRTLCRPFRPFCRRARLAGI